MQADSVSSETPDRGLSLLNKVALDLTARAVAAQERRERRYELIENRAARVSRLKAASGPVPRAGHSRVTVRNNDSLLSFDTAAARVRRAGARIHTWANAIPEQVERKGGKPGGIETPRLVMVTLTYADVAGWAAGDIRAYMTALRSILRGRLLAYAWVLEVQRRGAPHYHVLLYVRKGTMIPMPDKSGMWRRGSSRVETARTPHYVAKYIGKEYQKETLPGSARMFAVWVNRAVVGKEAYLLFRMSALPGWFRKEVLEILETGRGVEPGVWKRAKGGGWYLADTGEVFRSPWSLVGIEPIYTREIEYS